MRKIIDILFFSCAIGIAHGLVEETAFEQPCFAINQTAEIDPNWIPPSKMYYPLMSRLDFYRLARDLSGRDYNDIYESELYYDSCIEIDMGDAEDNMLMTGFNEKKLKIFLKNETTADGTKKCGFSTSFGIDGYSGTCSVTFTDQKTYMVSACCTNDNQMVWGVTSTEKALPKESIKAIHEHLTSLGFKNEYFTEFRYDKCPSKLNVLAY